MRSVDRIRIAAGSALAVAALAWVVPSLGAKPSPKPQFGGGGIGMTPHPPYAGGGGPEEPDAPRVYFKAPVSAEAASVWTALQKKVAVPFAAETSLEDFLKFIKTSTSDKENSEGVTLYVDPVGLNEAEKTMSSPITLNLGAVRLETALQLALSQLDLTFWVHPDGIVYITTKTSQDWTANDPNALILDRLEALQKQVAKLQSALDRDAPVAPRGAVDKH